MLHFKLYIAGNQTNLMRNLLAILLFFPTLCLAQLPDYVSPDGLIGWFPLNGSLESGIIGIPNGQINGPTGTTDRYGVSGGALNFDGIDDEATIDHYSGFENLEELTISIWLNPSEYPSAYATCGGGYGATYAIVSKWASTTASRTFLVFMSDWGPGSTGINPAGYLQVCNNSGGTTGCFQSSSYANFPLINWTHLAVTMGTDTTTIYVNGLSVYSGESGSTNGSLLHTSNPIVIGNEEDASATCPRFFSGQLDDLGFWNRALTQSEVESLFLSTAPIMGCTDTEACNFEPNANSDDGSCGYGCLYCGAGTVWDNSTSTCVVANPSDVDLDGCTGIGDVLEVLAQFGACYTQDSAVWACGDPLTYWDYDYTTVLIGDQCWFAENLRTTSYSDGITIPEVIDGLTWAGLGTGARCSYNNSASNAESYGLLYNWHSVNNVQGLCPVGWHVPSDGEWITLEIHLSMPEEEVLETGIRGSQGFDMKSISGWSNNGNGSNSSGFSGLPGGDRYYNGSFNNIEDGGYWWTSTASFENEFAFYRNLSSFNNGVSRFDYYQTGGFSVRCLKD